jgi:hypothetical protein
MRLAENTKAKPNANTRTLRPDKCLVVSDLNPTPRPVTLSRLWFQIRHHQGKSRANERHRFPYVLAANDTRLPTERESRPCLQPDAIGFFFSYFDAAIRGRFERDTGVTRAVFGKIIGSGQNQLLRLLK